MYNSHADYYSSFVKLICADVEISCNLASVWRKHVFWSDVFLKGSQSLMHLKISRKLVKRMPFNLLVALIMYTRQYSMNMRK